MKILNFCNILTSKKSLRVEGEGQICNIGLNDTAVNRTIKFTCYIF